MGLLAGLDALVVALALLGAMFAVSAVIRPLLVNVLARAPFIGGWLASNVDSGLADFQRAITAPANASMAIISSSLQWLADQGRAFTSGLTDLLNAAFWTSWTLATVTLPDAIGREAQRVDGAISDARGWALLQVQALEVRLGGEVAQVEGVAMQAVQDARSEALSEVSAAERIVLDEIRKAEQATGQLFQQAEYDAGQLVAASESKLASLVAQARADLGAGVAAVEHDLQLLARAERVALEDSVSVLGGDLQAAEARASAAIGALEESTQKSIEGILQGLPWQSLAAAVGAGEAMLQADVRTLVGLGAQEIRKAIGDAEAIRAKYGPQVRAALQELKV